MPQGFIHPESPIPKIKEEFRAHLEKLYAHLHLAPPYHSVEKAIQLLANTLSTKPSDFHQSVLADINIKWGFFRDIYTASGLERKHRGIISHYMKNHASAEMPDDTFQFLKHHPDFPKTWDNPNNSQAAGQEKH